MDIKEELNKLFIKRSAEYTEKFREDADSNQKIVFSYLEDLLNRGNSRYIIISPLYSSFITHSYEYKLGSYGKEMYLDEIGKSVFIALPFMKEHIEEDLDYIDNIVLNAKCSGAEISKYELSDIKYQYSLGYLVPAKQLWKQVMINYMEHVKTERRNPLLREIDILYGMYMERTENLLEGEKV